LIVLLLFVMVPLFVMAPPELITRVPWIVNVCPVGMCKVVPLGIVRDCPFVMVAPPVFRFQVLLAPCRVATVSNAMPVGGP
jgi:hypothetical protein